MDAKTFKDVYGDHSNEIHKGDLSISHEDLTSLEGCYKEVQGDFICNINEITSFEFCPEVQGDFICQNNNITSFEFCPNIKGDFYCSYNEITSFEHCPDIKGNFYCTDNEITSFEYCPEIKGDFDCSGNQLTSFKYCPEVQGDFNCSYNPNLQIDTDESLEGLLSADIQGEIKSSLDLSFYKEQRKIFNIVHNIKKLRLLNGFVEIGE